MALTLLPRGKCIHCPCAAFTTAMGLPTPVDAGAQCGLCRHRYFEHESSLDEILSQVSAIFRKAGIVGRCGGMVYFAHMTLTGSTPCPGCNEPLCAHGPPPTTPATAAGNGTDPRGSPRPPSQGARATASSIVLPPPALPGPSSLAIMPSTGATRAFPDFFRPQRTGPIQSPPGVTTSSSVNATRLQTAARTLHPPQPVNVDVRGSGSSRSRNARHPPAATATDAAVPPPTQSPAHRAPPSATTTSSTSTSLAAAASEATARAPSALAPSSLSAASTMVDLVIWPLVVSPDGQPDGVPNVYRQPDFAQPKAAHAYRLVHLRFLEQDLKAVVARLEEHQLCPTVLVNETLSGKALQDHIFGSALTQLRMADIQHFDAPEDDFPEPTVSALLNVPVTRASPPNDPFVFLALKKNSGKWMLNAVNPEAAIQLTFDGLCKLSGSSRSRATRPVVYLAPKVYHLLGRLRNISDVRPILVAHGPSHPCFGVRVLAGLAYASRRATASGQLGPAGTLGGNPAEMCFTTGLQTCPGGARGGSRAQRVGHRDPMQAPVATSSSMPSPPQTPRRGPGVHRQPPPSSPPSSPPRSPTISPLRPQPFPALSPLLGASSAPPSSPRRRRTDHARRSSDDLSPSPPRNRQRRGTITGFVPSTNEPSSDSEGALADFSPPGPLPLYDDETLHRWIVTTASYVPNTPVSQVLRLRGPDIAVLAKGLTEFVRWSLPTQKKEGAPELRKRLPAGVTIEMPVHPFAHMQVDRSELEPYVTIVARGRPITTGAGVWRELFMRAVEDLVADHRMWTPIGPDTGGGADGVGFVLPGGYGACTPEVLDEYRLHGTFVGLGCLLHGSLTYYGLWTGLALAMGENMMLLGDDFFSRYAPVVFRRMAKVRALSPASPISAPDTTADADDPRYLVCEELGENLAEAGGNTDRTPAAHAALVQRLWCKLLLNHKEPWQHPAFLAMRDGFNLFFGRRANLLQITKELDFSIPSLCVAMADRHVHDVEDFVKRIQLFHSPDDTSLANSPPEEVAAFRNAAAMVVDLVRHYARGRGHTPQSLRDTPHLTAQHPATDDDDCFRATLLLHACHGAKFRPIQPNWKLHVQVIPAAMKQEKPIHFHSCFTRMDIMLTPDLLEVVVEDWKAMGGDGARSDALVFHNVLHTQLLAVGSFYNSF